jgi:predicted glycosyltransferase involved in capsule biosynthesis
MTVESTILIANYHRNDPLRLNLESLVRQEIDNVEIVVLDDVPEPDLECQKVVDEFSTRLSIRYIHAGGNKTGDYWRVPGFAFNIGVKKTDSEFIFLCCAETFHRNDTYAKMVERLREHKTGAMVIPHGKTDSNGRVTAAIRRDGNISEEEFVGIQARLLVKYPFFMGMARSDFMHIGGYDEDFIGVGVEDKDLVDRLQWMGCKYVQTDAQILHLHHSRVRAGQGLQDGIEDRLQYNRDLYQKKKGTIIRNEDREWGIQ